VAGAWRAALCALAVVLLLHAAPGLLGPCVAQPARGAAGRPAARSPAGTARTRQVTEYALWRLRDAPGQRTLAAFAAQPLSRSAPARPAAPAHVPAWAARPTSGRLAPPVGGRPSQPASPAQASGLGAPARPGPPGDAAAGLTGRPGTAGECRQAAEVPQGHAAPAPTGALRPEAPEQAGRAALPARPAQLPAPVSDSGGGEAAARAVQPGVAQVAQRAGHDGMRAEADAAGASGADAREGGAEEAGRSGSDDGERDAGVAGGLAPGGLQQAAAGRADDQRRHQVAAAPWQSPPLQSVASIVASPGGTADWRGGAAAASAAQRRAAGLGSAGGAAPEPWNGPAWPGEASQGSVGGQGAGLWARGRVEEEERNSGGGGGGGSDAAIPDSPRSSGGAAAGFEGAGSVLAGGSEDAEEGCRMGGADRAGVCSGEEARAAADPPTLGEVGAPLGTDPMEPAGAAAAEADRATLGGVGPPSGPEPPGFARAGAAGPAGGAPQPGSARAGPPRPRSGAAGTAGALRTAEQISAAARASKDILKGPPRSSRDDPAFQKTFWAASRLHFIGSWKARRPRALLGGARPDPWSHLCLSSACLFALSTAPCPSWLGGRTLVAALLPAAEAWSCTLTPHSRACLPDSHAHAPPPRPRAAHRDRIGLGYLRLPAPRAGAHRGAGGQAGARGAGASAARARPRARHRAHRHGLFLRVGRRRAACGAMRSSGALLLVQGAWPALPCTRRFGGPPPRAPLASSVRCGRPPVPRPVLAGFPRDPENLQPGSASWAAPERASTAAQCWATRSWPASRSQSATARARAARARCRARATRRARSACARACSWRPPRRCARGWSSCRTSSRSTRPSRSRRGPLTRLACAALEQAHCVWHAGMWELPTPGPGHAYGCCAPMPRSGQVAQR